MTTYAWSVDLSVPPADAIERATTALAAQGFGILSRIEVHEAFQKKLGVTFRPYTILGACNPGFAHQALEADPAMGILLPCNVVIEGRDGGSRVWITRPEALFAVTGRDDLQHVAEEVGKRLAAVRDALAEEDPTAELPTTVLPKTEVPR